MLLLVGIQIGTLGQPNIPVPLIAVIDTLDCNLPSCLEKLVTFSFPTFVTKNRLPLYVDICPHHPSSVFPAEEVQIVYTKL